MVINLSHRIGSLGDDKITLDIKTPLCFVYSENSAVKTEAVQRFFDSFNTSPISEEQSVNLFYHNGRATEFVESFKYCSSLSMRFGSTKDAFIECNQIIDFARKKNMIVPQLLVLDDVPQDRISDVKFKNDFVTTLRNGRETGFRMIVFYSRGDGVLKELVPPNQFTLCLLDTFGKLRVAHLKAD